MWLELLSISRMKHHVKFTNERVLTTIGEVLECKGRRMYGVFCLTVFRTSIATSFKCVTCILALNRLVQVPGLLHVHAIQESYSHFNTRLFNMNVL